MTLRECYAALGGNYDDVVGRLRSERMVRKFVLKFLQDGSMAEENYSEAFRAAHTIKGICQNLGLSRLQDSSSRLCESLRNGYTPEAEELTRKVEEDYQQAASAILAFQEANPE